MRVVRNKGEIKGDNFKWYEINILIYKSSMCLCKMKTIEENNKNTRLRYFQFQP